MKENSPVSQLGNFVDRPWGVSEIDGNGSQGHRPPHRTVCPPPSGRRSRKRIGLRDAEHPRWVFIACGPQPALYR